MNEPRPDREPVPSPDDAAPDPVETHRDALKRLPKEIGGPKGPEPTRFGDWERNGRCTDF